MTYAPCKGCTDRNADCHSVCDKYRRYREIHEREKEAYTLDKAIDSAIRLSNHHRAVTRGRTSR